MITKQNVTLILALLLTLSNNQLIQRIRIHSTCSFPTRFSIYFYLFTTKASSNKPFPARMRVNTVELFDGWITYNLFFDDEFSIIKAG